MKKALKIIAYALGGLVVLALIPILYIQLSAIPTYDIPLKDIQVAVTPERVTRGAHLVSITCRFCHATGDKLDGKLITDPEEGFGEAYASNITQHPDYGIGKYTDAELYRLLRTGVKRNNQLALPMMLKSYTMADEDIYSIIAFLHSEDPMVQPSEKITPPYQPTFLVKLLYRIAFEPLPYPEDPIKVPALSDQVAYGKYLVDGALVCFDCHSASFETNNLMAPDQSPGYLGGGQLLSLPGMEAPVKAANITMDSAGIAHYSEEDFISTVMWGRKPDGTATKFPMSPYAFLDTAEVLAIHAYLQTVQPVDPSREVAGND